MAEERPLRVLHAPTMVAGLPQAVAAAERELGLDSRSVAFVQTAYGYDADDVLFAGARGRPAHELRRWRFLARAARDFDVVHFNAGESIMPAYQVRETSGVGQRLFDAYARTFELRDVGWLKRLGKAVFVTYLGSDVRLGDYANDHFEISYLHEAHDEANPDDLKRRRIRTFDRWADGIYSVHPDLMWTLPARAVFIPHTPVDLREWRPVPPAASGPPLLVHAPTSRAVKGTALIEAAVAQLRSEGLEFGFELVEGVPRSEARAVYERADLLVEQLLLGWHSSLAVELMALGKPVVSYIREEDLVFLPEGMRAELPIVSATPNSIADVLRELLTTRRAELPELGRRSRAYVERWYDPLDLARRLKADYEAATRARRADPAA
jgi:hypothetical protein